MHGQIWLAAQSFGALPLVSVAVQVLVEHRRMISPRLGVLGCPRRTVGQRRAWLACASGGRITPLVVYASGIVPCASAAVARCAMVWLLWLYRGIVRPVSVWRWSVWVNDGVAVRFLIATSVTSLCFVWRSCFD